MKRLFVAVSAWMLTVFLASSPALSQTQELEGYTVIKGGTDPLICLGRWVPPSEIGRPGICEGQMVNASQLAAVSSKLAADRLDQVLNFLVAMDQKLAENNAQFERLIEALANTQAAIERQTEQNGELIRDAITARFESLARRVLTSEALRKEIERLREEILKEVTKSYSRQPKK